MAKQIYKHIFVAKRKNFFLFVFPISEHLFECIGTQFPPPSAILYGKVILIREFF